MEIEGTSITRFAILQDELRIRYENERINRVRLEGE